MANPFGFTYPTRYNTPSSQVVKSDGEWDSEWQKKLAGVPQTISTQGPEIWQNVSDMWRAGDPNATSYVNQIAQQGLQTKWTPTGYDAGGSPMSDFMVMTGYGPGSSYTNPEWQKLNNQYTGQKQNRQESQTAQQQAYTNMLGNYQANGVIGGDYTNPNFGLVTGTTDTGMPQPNNETWSSGVYDPNQQSGTYNPNMVNKTFWGL